MRVKRWELIVSWFLWMFLLFGIVWVVNDAFELRAENIDREILKIDHRIWKTERQNEEFEKELDQAKRNIEFLQDRLSEMPDYGELEGKIDLLYEYIGEVDDDLENLMGYIFP